MRDGATAARAIERDSHCALRSWGDRPTLPPAPRERTWVARVGSATKLIVTLGYLQSGVFSTLDHFTIWSSPETLRQYLVADHYRLNGLPIESALELQQRMGVRDKKRD